MQVVHSEQSLQTAAITSQLQKVEGLSQELLILLKQVDLGEKSTPRQIFHQLTCGSKEEQDLDNIIKRMNSMKTNLLIHIQVAGVGLMIDKHNNLVANSTIINRVDHVIQEVLGDGRGLKIAGLIKNQPVQGKYSTNRLARNTCFFAD